MTNTYNECVSYPDPGEPMPFAPSAIYIGGAGDLVVTDRYGNVAAFTAPAGTTIQVDAFTIEPNTTATGLVLMRRRSSL